VARGRYRIAHPSGTIEVEIAIGTNDAGGIEVTRAALLRTARKLMDGTVYVPRDRVIVA
jgi:2-methylaconitate cis-trans-isomerase PrpF